MHRSFILALCASLCAIVGIIDGVMTYSADPMPRSALVVQMVSTGLGWLFVIAAIAAYRSEVERA